MNSNSRWISLTVILTVASLTFAGVEPAAFAAPPEEPAKSEERAATSPPAVVLPNRPARPALMTTAVAQAIPPVQSPRVGSSADRSTYIPPAKQSQGKSKKWLYIILAAAGAGAAVAIIAAGDDPEPQATIEIGNPVVGAPQ